MRRTPALIVAAAVAAVLASSLAGCSTGGTGGCTPAYSSGGASKLVTATGAVGTAPKVDFPTPLVTDGTQQSTIVEGTGDPIPDRGTVDFEATVLDGKTGAPFLASAYTDNPVRYIAAGAKYTLNQSLMCAKTGERYALTSTAAAAFGKGALSGQYGIADDDTIVLVIDIVANYLGKANGLNQLPQDGMPTVVTAVDGQPGIQVPPTKPPTSTRIETVKAGGGAEVKDGDTVVVNYTGWTWPTTVGDVPSQFDGTWDAGKVPVNVIAKQGANTTLTLPAGFIDAITGAKVGSQVQVVIPPKDGFGSVTPPSGVEATSTLIYVIDILGIVKK